MDSICIDVTSEDVQSHLPKNKKIKKIPMCTQTASTRMSTNMITKYQIYQGEDRETLAAGMMSKQLTHPAEESVRNHALEISSGLISIFLPVINMRRCNN
jgi:hypothetical protein